MTANSVGTRAAVKRLKVDYGEADSQFGHLYLPVLPPARPDDEAHPIPVVVIVHGGYWSTDFELIVETPVARNLAERGAIVWNVEYRRVGEEGGGWPRTGYDVANGILALDGPVRAALPPEIARRADFAHVSVIGHSAGGQLALWAVGRLGAKTPKATITTIVVQAPATDLVEVGQNGHVALAAFIGASYAETPHRYRDASPVYLPVIPAHVVVVQGDLDVSVPLEMSRSYVERVRANGQSVELVTVMGEGHEAFVDPTSRCHRETLRRLGI
ncbi:alpha/beta hydrolase family protein [Williamsia maris]|uniref:alpha/beta hydrolase family protein n=1 Tax=Williamsia maris TaxID=72806 RepID=UPI0020A3437C|nr:alpha/beta hydrolase [Williamsia maris]